MDTIKSFAACVVGRGNESAVARSNANLEQMIMSFKNIWHTKSI